MEKMNKKGMYARDYIIILILFGAVCIIGSLIVADIAGTESGYGVSGMVDENFKQHYDTLKESTSDIGKMQNATTSEAGTKTISQYTEIFRATFSLISIIFGSLGMTSDTLTHFATDFEIPKEIANIIFSTILGVLTTILIFVIISSVSKSKI